MQGNDLVKMLLAIDEEAWLLLGDVDPKPTVIIVGGAAFMLRNITPRKTTHDIDVYRCDEAAKSILARYPAVNNGVFSAYSDQIPYNFKDRLTILDIGAKGIEFATPSVEDLVVMKLYAERGNDIQDIDGAVESGAVDWGLLDMLVYDPDEAAASALS